MVEVAGGLILRLLAGKKEVEAVATTVSHVTGMSVVIIMGMIGLVVVGALTGDQVEVTVLRSHESAASALTGMTRLQQHDPQHEVFMR